MVGHSKCVRFFCSEHGIHFRYMCVHGMRSPSFILYNKFGLFSEYMVVGNSDGMDTSQDPLAKTILQGTVEGARRKGRQKNRWEDNINEWT